MSPYLRFVDFLCHLEAARMGLEDVAELKTGLVYRHARSGAQKVGVEFLKCLM